jgi:peptidoglycan/xylan/chitin deacetylase (PgdA/CDA1 family)
MAVRAARVMPGTETPRMSARATVDTGIVWLTFDDGPDNTWTPRMLDLLAAAGARATFFVVGKLARATPALLRRAAGEGHTIGNHSWSHRHPWLLSSSAARREVRDGAAAIADILGSAPAHYRPPHGRLRRCALEEARAGGQALVLWSVSAVDWGPLGSASGIGARLNKVNGGDIVLMHDGGRGINRPDQLALVLPGFLARLRQRGLSAASLDKR